MAINLLLTTHRNIPSREEARHLNIVVRGESCDHNTDILQAELKRASTDDCSRCLLPEKTFLTNEGSNVTLVACEEVPSHVKPLPLSSNLCLGLGDKLDVGRSIYVVGHTTSPSPSRYVVSGVSVITSENGSHVTFSADQRKGHYTWLQGSAGFDREGSFSFLVSSIQQDRNNLKGRRQRFFKEQEGVPLTTIMEWLEDIGVEHLISHDAVGPLSTSLLEAKQPSPPVSEEGHWTRMQGSQRAKFTSSVPQQGSTDELDESKESWEEQVTTDSPSDRERPHEQRMDLPKAAAAGQPLDREDTGMEDLQQRVAKLATFDMSSEKRSDGVSCTQDTGAHVCDDSPSDAPAQFVGEDSGAQAGQADSSTTANGAAERGSSKLVSFAAIPGGASDNRRHLMHSAPPESAIPASHEQIQRSTGAASSAAWAASILQEAANKDQVLLPSSPKEGSYVTGQRTLKHATCEPDHEDVTLLRDTSNLSPQEKDKTDDALPSRHDADSWTHKASQDLTASDPLEIKPGALSCHDVTEYRGDVLPSTNLRNAAEMGGYGRLLQTEVAGDLQGDGTKVPEEPPPVARLQPAPEMDNWASKQAGRSSDEASEMRLPRSRYLSHHVSNSEKGWRHRSTQQPAADDLDGLHLQSWKSQKDTFAPAQAEAAAAQTEAVSGEEVIADVRVEGSLEDKVLRGQLGSGRFQIKQSGEDVTVSEEIEVLDWVRLRISERVEKMERNERLRQQTMEGERFIAKEGAPRPGIRSQVDAVPAAKANVNSAADSGMVHATTSLSRPLMESFGVSGGPNVVPDAELGNQKGPDAAEDLAPATAEGTLDSGARQDGIHRSDPDSEHEEHESPGSVEKDIGIPSKPKGVPEGSEEGSEQVIGTAEDTQARAAEANEGDSRTAAGIIAQYRLVPLQARQVQSPFKWAPTGASTIDPAPSADRKTPQQLSPQGTPPLARASAIGGSGPSPTAFARVTRTSAQGSPVLRLSASPGHRPPQHVTRAPLAPEGDPPRRSTSLPKPATGTGRLYPSGSGGRRSPRSELKSPRGAGALQTKPQWPGVEAEAGLPPDLQTAVSPAKAAHRSPQLGGPKKRARASGRLHEDTVSSAAKRELRLKDAEGRVGASQAVQSNPRSPPPGSSLKAAPASAPAARPSWQDPTCAAEAAVGSNVRQSPRPTPLRRAAAEQASAGEAAKRAVAASDALPPSPNGHVASGTQIM